MRFDPIVPLPLDWDANGVPYSRTYGDVYHPAAGPGGQARHVFLGGNGLPSRWQGKDRFVVLETGFGLGHNFLATWQAWRDDPQRCARLHFISIEKHPLIRAELARAHAASQWPELSQALIDSWPPLTPDLHSLIFEDGKVELLLALGDVQVWLPQLMAQVDAFYLDGFAPARNPTMWEPRVFKALARLAAHEATLATWSVARTVRDGLRSAGFRVEQAQGFGGKREMTLACFAPTFTPRGAAARRNLARAGQPHRRHAVIVGAGLAGCATAWALAQQGWTSTLLERQTEPAREGSGNPAGAFHGIVNAQDGAHSRFNRCAALHAQRVISLAVQSGLIVGNLNGLLRLEQLRDVATMRHSLLALGLPQDFVRALDPAQASETSAMAISHPAWFYPGGGCVDPGALARYFVQRCLGACSFRGGTAVNAIRRIADGWQIFDAGGRLIEQTPHLVLANASEALRLLGDPDWPLRALRGQVSAVPAAAWPVDSPQPQLAISGDGFVLPEMGGQILFGATSSHDDCDVDVRSRDHLANLERLARLCRLEKAPPLDALVGRVAWRCSSVDRLPLIGAVALEQADATSRRDQTRFIPRVPGLYVFIGLGSRGITWCALGARLLASMLAGSPAPLPAGLIDAVDPARFMVRRERKLRAGANPSAPAAETGSAQETGG